MFSLHLKVATGALNLIAEAMLEKGMFNHFPCAILSVYIFPSRLILALYFPWTLPMQGQ